MRATGIVRRIDDLGRIVIPKEIRKTMRIKEGDPIEIYTADDGVVILKKYSQIFEVSDFAQNLVDSIVATTNHTVCITDNEKIVVSKGPLRKDFDNKLLSKKCEECMKTQEEVLTTKKDGNLIQIVDKNSSYSSCLIVPIVVEGFIQGSLIILSKDDEIGKTESVLAKTISLIISKHIG